MKILRDHLIAKMSEISNEFYLLDSHGFIELSERLTLLNGRCGGEPARLLLSDWEFGVNEQIYRHQNQMQKIMLFWLFTL